MEINELLVHRAIASKPELIEAGLGIKLDENSLQHHYPLSDKGEHIDFVFKDISGTTYLAEVKLGVPPISAIPQLYDHEYRKFIDLNSDLDRNRIIPVIVIDRESVTNQDVDILSKMNIKLCIYDLGEIEDVLKEKDLPHPPIEFPDLGVVEAFLNEARDLWENYGDIDLLLKGFSGEEWWDGYYDFRVFWLWKERKFPDIHKRIFQLLFKGRKEDAIWFAFLAAISDSDEVASHIIFDKGWTWSQVLPARNHRTKWDKFEDCLCNSGTWHILALLDYDKRKQVIKNYLEKVGDSQERYFLGVMSQSDNPFDAYNQVWESIHDIHNVGNVVAGMFAAYLSQWRILPIIPRDRVKVSRFVERALRGILQPMESPQDALLRLARKYSVTPIVIERAMHKLGRSSEEQ